VTKKALERRRLEVMTDIRNIVTAVDEVNAERLFTISHTLELGTHLFGLLQ